MTTTDFEGNIKCRRDPTISASVYAVALTTVLRVPHFSAATRRTFQPAFTRVSGSDMAVGLDRFEAMSIGRILRDAGPVDPRSVASIGFLLADKTPSPFALEVAWIKVHRGQGR